MTTLAFIHDRVFPIAFSLLPPGMDTPAARAMLLAIGLQESKFVDRIQIDGPARGFWQFEQGGGVKGVLSHPKTISTIQGVCSVLRYTPTPTICYAAIAHNDVLATCFARLNLWTTSKPLPNTDDALSGWDLYLRTWHPGKPHRTTWDAYYAQGWQIVLGGGS